MRKILFGGILLFASSANAVVVTLDFEGVAADNSSVIPSSPYIEDGMLVDSDRIENGIFGKDAYSASNGSAAYAWCHSFAFIDCISDARVTLNVAAGGVFDLLGFDSAAVAAGGPLSLVGPLQVTGYLAGGGTISTQLNLSTSWQTFNFGSAWSDLVAVEIYGDRNAHDGDIALDNIVVNVVPIPAAAWLFGSALAGLGWLRRKQVSS